MLEVFIRVQWSLKEILGLLELDIWRIGTGFERSPLLYRTAYLAKQLVRCELYLGGVRKSEIKIENWALSLIYF